MGTEAIGVWRRIFPFSALSVKTTGEQFSTSVKASGEQCGEVAIRQPPASQLGFIVLPAQCRDKYFYDNSKSGNCDDDKMMKSITKRQL